MEQVKKGIFTVSNPRNPDGTKRTWYSLDNVERPTEMFRVECDFLGHHIVIKKNRLNEPSSYVSIMETMIETNEDDETFYVGPCLDVNGGDSYCGPCYWNADDDRMYVGWDYGHNGDFSPLNAFFGGKKWEFAEIYAEAISAVTKIVMAENGDIPF